MAVYSHSRISTFEDCPKKYEFSYVLKAPKGAETVEQFLGSRVHEALEWLHAEVRACHVPSADELTARLQVLWDAAWTDEVAVTREERTADDYRAIGEKAVRDYHARYAPFDQGRTVGLEMKVAFPLDESGTVEILGYIDRLTKVADGVWEIHDYKTGNSLPTQARLDADRQLALYEMAVRAAYPDAREVTLVWHYLAFDHEARSRRTPEQLEAVRRDTIERVREIERATEFHTRTSPLCDWCEFRGICPAWAHEQALSELAPDDLADEPGLVLVDRYMEASRRVAEAEAERDALKDAIVRAADEGGLDALCGTDTVVKVWRYTNVGLPGSKDPARQEVEELLRHAGLLERFSTLSTFELSKAVEGRALPDDVLRALEPYVTLSRGAKLYPRKRG